MVDLLNKLGINLGVILSILIPSIVASLIYLGQRRKKQLSYEVLSSTAILGGVDTDLKKDLKILYNDEEIQNVFLVLIRFKNTGKEPINSKDYEEEVSLYVGPIQEILMCDVKETDPQALKTSVKLENVRPLGLFIKPVLLNKGDSFTLKLLISNYSNDVLISGRISGVKEIKPVKKTFFQLKEAVTFISMGALVTNLVISYILKK